MCRHHQQGLLVFIRKHSTSISFRPRLYSHCHGRKCRTRTLTRNKLSGLHHTRKGRTSFNGNPLRKFHILKL